MKFELFKYLVCGWFTSLFFLFKMFWFFEGVGILIS